ncbi:MAG: polyprenol monophosphomannose synthase [Nitrososphaerales archaeon]|nr:polyprenol monophosphomannose synthase [Nitrososphaerales archaeon]
MKACVVVPTYNEKKMIRALVQSVENNSPPDMEILFVDDSSPDGTADEVRGVAATDARVHLLLRPRKAGIGAAHLDGFRKALETIKPDVIIEMDADLQHPPQKLVELVSAIAGGADVAVASRKVKGGGTVGWSIWRRAVSRGANWMARIVLGLGVRDSTSGYRALSSRAASVLVNSNLPTSSYSFQVASLYLLKKEGMKMVEVPFTFQVRMVGKSKMGFGEILEFFWSVLKLRLRGVD